MTVDGFGRPTKKHKQSNSSIQSLSPTFRQKLSDIRNRYTKIKSDSFGYPYEESDVRNKVVLENREC